MEQRLSIITLTVSEIKKSKNFYEKLGWKKAENNTEDSICFFNLNGMALALYPASAAAKETGKFFSPPTPPNLSNENNEKANNEEEKPQERHCITLAYNVASEEAVDNALARAVASGAQLVKKAEKVFWGGYSGYFSDPDGYLWEVAFNPFAKLEENGNFSI